MKNLFKIGFAALASVMLFAACNDNSGDTATPDDGTTKIKVSVSAANPSVQGDTRLFLDGDKTDGFTPKWDENETIGVFALCGDDPTVENNNIEFEFFHIENNIAYFYGELSIPSGTSHNYGIYAYHPYVSSADGCSHDVLNHTIPAAQTLRNNGMYDPMAEFMVGTSQTLPLTDSHSELLLEDFYFNRKVTMINICAGSKITEWAGDILPLLDTEKIQSIKFTAPEGIVLAGDFTVDLRDPDRELNFGTNGTNSVTAVLDTHQSFADLNVWILTAPFEYQGGGELFDIELVTDKYTVTRTFSLAKAVEFSESTVNLLALNFISGYTVTPKTPVEKVRVEFFKELFGDETDYSSNRPKIAAMTNWSMKAPIAYSDSYGRADIRSSKETADPFISPSVWLPTTGESELLIKGISSISSNYTDLILSFDIASNAAAGNSSLTHISVSYAQKATPDVYQLITLPVKAFGSQNVFISITDIILPDDVDAIKFYYSKTPGSGYRIDNVAITGLQ